MGYMYVSEINWELVSQLELRAVECECENIIIGDKLGLEMYLEES